MEIFATGNGTIQSLIEKAEFQSFLLWKFFATFVTKCYNEFMARRFQSFLLWKFLQLIELVIGMAGEKEKFQSFLLWKFLQREQVVRRV